MVVHPIPILNALNLAFCIFSVPTLSRIVVCVMFHILWCEFNTQMPKESNNLIRKIVEIEYNMLGVYPRTGCKNINLSPHASSFVECSRRHILVKPVRIREILIFETGIKPRHRMPRKREHPVITEVQMRIHFPHSPHRIMHVKRLRNIPIINARNDCSHSQPITTVFQQQIMKGH